MLFTSSKESKVVSSKDGFIHFKNGRYETDNEDEIEALKKCEDVFMEETEEVEEKEVETEVEEVEEKVVEKPKKETKSK